MASASSMGRPVIAPASWGLTPPFVSVPQALAFAAMSAAPIPLKSKVSPSTSSASAIWSAMMRPTGCKVRCRKRLKSSFFAVPSLTDIIVTGTPAAASMDSSTLLRSWTIACGGIMPKRLLTPNHQRALIPGPRPKRHHSPPKEPG